MEASIKSSNNQAEQKMFLKMKEPVIVPEEGGSKDVIHKSVWIHWNIMFYWLFFKKGN